MFLWLHSTYNNLVLVLFFHCFFTVLLLFIYLNIRQNGSLGCVTSSIIIIIYFENVYFLHAKLGLDVCPREVSTHPWKVNTAHSGCKPSPSMSSYTHSLQVSLFLPLYLPPATSTYLQADTQSSTHLCSRCPSHLTSICHASPHPLCIDIQNTKNKIKKLWFDVSIKIGNDVGYDDCS